MLRNLCVLLESLGALILRIALKADQGVDLWGLMMAKTEDFVHKVSSYKQNNILLRGSI